jgi:hypothetical protein
MLKVFLLSLLACLAVACGHAAPTAVSDCPEARQLGCPAGTLTYDTGIGDLLTARCSPCHAEGGIEGARRLTDYSHAFGSRMSIATQLVSCSMPPSGAPPLTHEERQQVLDWLTCGAPR